MKHIYFCACDKNGGIYHYTKNGNELTFLEKTPLDRPMYMIIRDDKAHIILKETDSKTKFGGYLTFDIDENGKLTNPSEIISTNGVVPCHLEVDSNTAYTVNYVSGSISKTGEKTVTHEGSSIHPTRQTSAHTHYTALTPDKKYLFCVDLGQDSIFVYDKDLNEISRAKVPDGYGARHLISSADGKYVYCVNELISSVSVFEYLNGKLTYLDTYDALPDFKEQNTAAAIRIDGKYLYISNRGADTITRFEICGDKLKLLENTPCGGIGPRDFDITDGKIYCTNEQSNDVTVLALKDGKPVLTDEKYKMGNPLCVTFLDK
ncbi:MAG: lactonase family protein [Clostridia bacterium]|nr:lactonase family protein [Clostridia bacterium]